MAQFTDLPTELVLYICSHLRPKYNIQDIFALAQYNEEEGQKSSRPTYTPLDRFRHDAVASVLRPGLQDLLSLSLTSRKHQDIIIDSLYLYRDISIHGTNRVSKMIGLLRLITAKPEVGLAVRQLYLELFDGYTYMDATLPRDFAFVHRVASSAGISCPGNLWVVSAPSRSQYRIQDSIEFAQYGILVKLLLLKMTNLEQLGCTVSEFNLRLPGSRQSSPQLPKLTSFAVRPVDVNLDWEDINFDIIKNPGSSIRNLYMETGNSSSGLCWQSLTPSLLKDITCLTLNQVAFSRGDIDYIIKKCGPLKSFKYIQSYELCYDNAEPRDIVQALRETHVDTLRVICIDFYGASAVRNTIDTLTDFDKLESLWMDLYSFIPGHGSKLERWLEDEEAAGSRSASHRTPNGLIRTLPRTLRRLYFRGFISRISHDLLWLGSNLAVYSNLSYVGLTTLNHVKSPPMLDLCSSWKAITGFELGPSDETFGIAALGELA
ncbi:hypothetical protein EsH8_IX_000948 [Colletotrichum jinshuiense]